MVHGMSGVSCPMHRYKTVLNEIICARKLIFSRDEFFTLQLDRIIVEDALRELKFNYITGESELSISTNAIWFGNDVPIEDVKLVAYTLIRAGVEIKAIAFLKLVRYSREQGAGGSREQGAGRGSRHIIAPVSVSKLFHRLKAAHRMTGLTIVPLKC